MGNWIPTASSLTRDTVGYISNKVKLLLYIAHKQQMNVQSNCFRLLRRRAMSTERTSNPAKGSFERSVQIVSKFSSVKRAVCSTDRSKFSFVHSLIPLKTTKMDGACFEVLQRAIVHLHDEGRLVQRISGRFQIPFKLPDALVLSITGKVAV